MHISILEALKKCPAVKINTKTCLNFCNLAFSTTLPPVLGGNVG